MAEKQSPDTNEEMDRPLSEGVKNSEGFTGNNEAEKGKDLVISEETTWKMEMQNGLANEARSPVLIDPIEEETPANRNMEVHHHPQLQHRAKAWKEYFLEGVMIFIAVMMGFIAENIREGITNREHVKELVSQLKKDLKNDTIRLNDIYDGESRISKSNDSLIALLQTPLDGINKWQMEQLIVRSHDFWPFHPSTGAIGAIKNELHLREFSGSKMIGAIADYEWHVDLLHTVQEITLQYQRSYLEPFLIRHFTATSLEATFNKLPGAHDDVRNLTQEELTQLGAGMVLIRINTGELLKNNRKLKLEALNLLQYLNQEYSP